MDDILARSVAIFVIGNRPICEHICEEIAFQGENLTHVNVSHEQIQGTQHDSLAILLERIGKHFGNGKRMFLVSGYPESIEDAKSIAKQFTHMITFSVEKERVLTGRVQDVKRILATRGQIHLVSESGKPVRFIENKLREYLLGKRIEMGANGHAPRARAFATSRTAA